MREIKFRAWYKPKGKMYTRSLESINLETKVLGVYTVSEGYQQLRMSDFELMQYTGLKDNNGKEIYEGDIVEERWANPLAGGENVDRYKIEYNGLTGIYKMIHTSGEERWHRALFLRFKEVEVVGNIYENPELLEVG
jgi:uncharacterized phage protein (TIGR01671 family)